MDLFSTVVEVPDKFLLNGAYYLGLLQAALIEAQKKIFNQEFGKIQNGTIIVVLDGLIFQSMIT